MSTTNEIKTYFGRCRCCLNYGYLKNMWEEHQWEGEKEIYVEMLVKCFALTWEHSDETMEHDQICESCIKRLRDAHVFKKVILDSQEELLGQLDESGTPIKIERAEYDEKEMYAVEIEEDGTADRMYIDEPDDHDYVYPDDPDDPDYTGVPNDVDDPDDPGVPNDNETNDVEYEQVEYLEDDVSLAEQSNSATTRKRSKTAVVIKPDTKWPQKLPRTQRYKTYKQYSEEDLRECLDAVRNAELTYHEASIKYKIPQKTIVAKCKLGPKDAQYGNTEGTTKKMGRYFFNREVIHKFKENVRNILENSNATPLKGHWGIGYGCSYCPYQNPLPSVLKKHTLATHFDVIDALKVKSYIDLIIKLDITGLQCKLCCENFNILNDFMTHLSLFHDIDVYTDIKNHIIPFKFDTEYLRCTICSKQFDYFKHLSEHMNEHFRNYECHICGRAFINKRSLKTHLFRHQTGVFICSYCSKVFDTRIKMREHERVLHVRASKTRKCGYCDEKFMDPVRKTYHEVTVHGAKAPSFECKACGKMYDSQRALKSHTNQYHLMLKPHTCEECGKGFYYKNELKRHEVKHTGLREFQCEHCLKWYSTRKSLRVHLRIHQNDRRYRCEECGQAFVQKSNWIQHMRSKHGEEV